MLRTPGALPSLRSLNTSLYTESDALYTAACEAVDPRPPLEPQPRSPLGKRAAPLGSMDVGRGGVSVGHVDVDVDVDVEVDVVVAGAPGDSPGSLPPKWSEI